MNPRPLTPLVETALDRSWRRDSPWHGEEHWRCVATTGLELAGALDLPDRTLVFCFGLLHDTRRRNETVDPEHGLRAERFADELLVQRLLPLDAACAARLGEALRLHSDGLVSEDPAIAACWDADRLHLPRVGIEPDPARFSTAAARAPDATRRAGALRERGAPAWSTLLGSLFASS